MNPAQVSDRCCRPRRPTSRREGGRESPPTREGSGILGATDPDYAGGAKQPNTILTAQAISPPPPTEHDERPRKRTRDPPHPGKEEARVRKEEEFGGGIRRRRRRRSSKDSAAGLDLLYAGPECECYAAPLFVVMLPPLLRGLMVRYDGC